MSDRQTETSPQHIVQ